MPATPEPDDLDQHITEQLLVIPSDDGSVEHVLMSDGKEIVIGWGSSVDGLTEVARTAARDQVLAVGKACLDEIRRSRHRTVD